MSSCVLNDLGRISASCRIGRNSDETRRFTGPKLHQHETFAFVARLAQGISNLRRRAHRLTGHFDDHIPDGEAALACTSAWLDPGDGDALAAADARERTGRRKLQSKA